MTETLFAPSGRLRDDLAQLLGQDELSSFAHIPEADRLLGASGNRWRFHCLMGLSRFWVEESSSQPRRESREGNGESALAPAISKDELDRAVEDLLAALYVGGRPIAFLILDRAPKVEIYWGTPVVGDLDDEMAVLLASALPGAQLNEASGADGGHLQELNRLDKRALMTGIPTPKRDQTERVLRGLLASGSQAGALPHLTGKGEACWAYIVLARPLEMARITATLETIAEEIRRVGNTHLRRGSVEEGNHPLARYYVELLEAALDKYQAAQLQGAWEVRSVFLATDQPTLRRGMSLLAAAFSGNASRPRPLRIREGIPAPARLEQEQLCPGTVLNTPDLAVLVRPPRQEFPGYAISIPRVFGLALPESESEADRENAPRRVAIGSVLDRGGRRATGEWLELDVEDFAKHALITGVTGSGKTETCFFLLDQLWREHEVPFLVIEPAKREYRALVGVEGYADLKVYSLGEEQQHEFRLNPFEVPPGIHVQMHIDLLRVLFNASFSGLYAPMPYLLEEALYELYEERGWNLVTGGRPDHAFCTRNPTLSEFVTKVDEVVTRAGYDSEVTQNVATALRVRLNSLSVGAKGRILDTRDSLPMEELLARPAILELAGIGDPETAAFLMGLLWMRLYEHRLAQGPHPLRHLTLVEEAHRLLARATAQSAAHSDAPQIREKALETFSQMLMELRAFGEGLFIADQSPTKIHSDALKGTNLKVAHRLVAEEDRKAVGGSTNMSDTQERALATLAVGQAAVYAEGLEMPFLVRIPPFRRYALPEEPQKR